MKKRNGWYVVWPDGTSWWGDCPRWAAQPLPDGCRLVPVKIYGEGTKCPECAEGRH
jgi:hypothetical protein